MLSSVKEKFSRFCFICYLKVTLPNAVLFFKYFFSKEVNIPPGEMDKKEGFPF